MDADQGFRDRECTTRPDIEVWARELKADVAPVVSLAGAQFRLAGSVEYVDWLEHTLGLRQDASRDIGWRRSPSNPDGKLVFEVVPDPLALEEALRPRVEAGESARLLAAYGVPWVSQPKAKKKGSKGPASKAFDFDFEVLRDGSRQRWKRIWNWVPDGDDYTLFVQAPPGTGMGKDPLSEVGCPYVVRGFDYDWVGILWLLDLVWRHGHWTVDLDHIHETGVKGTLQEARRERERRIDGPAHAELVRRVAQAYRILLSRAMKGLYLWVQDDETRGKLLSDLGGAET
jgi:hypothetical protein